MEAVGLGVGFVGLAGLFTACLDAIDKISSYRSSRTDARDLDAQLVAEKLRLERWGRKVGFEGGSLSVDHHPGLDDERIHRAVEDLLTIIRDICEPAPGPGSGPSELSQSTRTGLSEKTETRWKRFTWAIRGKEGRTKEVDLLAKIIQQLHYLVPPAQEDGMDPHLGPDFTQKVGLFEDGKGHGPRLLERLANIS